MLWLGLMTRDTGVPASSRLGIRDAVLALDFDRAVSLRLYRFDNEVYAERTAREQHYLARLLTKVLVGDDIGPYEDPVKRSPENVLDADILDIIRNDPYADEDTVIL